MNFERFIYGADLVEVFRILKNFVCGKIKFVFVFQNIIQFETPGNILY